ncbi:hypothetical protein A3D09_02925 [Candidatus Collierbacteria bacterium RIFCSPHIGHO2_02_FULL_49_10]|uniref:HAD family phosphatase n=1 Tax=Candidatus Collierbacteria bacterium RIFCSPHIGHO2_02_FULL_49_10 TaxID=1817723 RepID=A0A1F5EXZ0_9BACT|nr:MAG: hypothetical protein A3D09_02925 [Candidatus Collierbacteria bacterium RIFCSPHIGHO2_02_FULL_49_10]
MIKAIIFDCGEVLIQGMHGVQTAIAQLVGITEQEVWDQINREPKNQMFCGLITEREYWEAVIEDNQWLATSDQLIQIMRDNFTEVPGTRQIIERLCKVGYKLGLLSVHTREWVEHCEAEHQYHHLFDVIQYSYEVGMRKPNPLVFLKILEDLGVGPGEAVFIDDHPKNIQAARDLGIQAILFTSAEQLTVEFKALLPNYG